MPYDQYHKTIVKYCTDGNLPLKPICRGINIIFLVPQREVLLSRIEHNPGY